MNKVEKRCFSLIQQIVCRRNPFCQRCGATPVSGHHVMGRRNHGSAFEPDSCLALCVSCHDGWARTWPLECQDLLREKIGAERYVYLAALSRETSRLREKDFREIAEGLKKRLEKVK